MPSSFQEQKLTSDQRRAVDRAVQTFQDITDGVLLAMVFGDKRGAFVYLCPGYEREVLKVIQTIDWHSAERIIEEHVP